MKVTILCESRRCGWREVYTAPARAYLPACCDKCGAPSQDLLLVVGDICEACGDTGWLHAHADGNTPEDREIQRCQTCDLLPSDAVAAQRHRVECACGWREVSRRYAAEGGTMHPIPTFSEVTT